MSSVAMTTDESLLSMFCYGVLVHHCYPGGFSFLHLFSRQWLEGTVSMFLYTCQSRDHQGHNYSFFAHIIWRSFKSAWQRLLWSLSFCLSSVFLWSHDLLNKDQKVIVERSRLWLRFGHLSNIMSSGSNNWCCIFQVFKSPLRSLCHVGKYI